MLNINFFQTNLCFSCVKCPSRDAKSGGIGSRDLAGLQLSPGSVSAQVGWGGGKWNPLS